MFIRLLLLLTTLLTLTACTQTQVVHLGDTQVKLVKLTVDLNKKPKHFVHVHENETTALNAATRYIHSYGGTVVTLKHSGQRNIVFHLNGVRYEVDPNRIYTDAGIKKSLTLYGQYSPQAHQAVNQLAAKIKQWLPSDSVIAVHNNRNYSIKEYFPKHSLAGDASKLNYKPHTNARNFYFVTQYQDYNRLVSKSFNVALQSLHAQDDGSLSYYLARKKYINIEAAFGDLNAQINMLEQA